VAAIAAAGELGIPFAVSAAALATFGGIHRRFEVVAEAQGVMVVDDYGHHPEEVRATLRAAREGFAQRRLVVAFQPHRFTRTRDLFADFVDAFEAADLLVLTEIYPAGERPIEGVSAAALAAALRRRGRPEVVYVPQRRAVAEALRERVRPGDLVLVLGAGDIVRSSRELAALLGHAEAAVQI
jgi:UDP-N-acetylmuramate--alanine ligase